MLKLLSLRFQHCFGPLPCYLSKGPLKRDFLDIFFTKFSGVRKFKTTSAVQVIFFLKMFKIESRFPKFNKKLGKCFFVSEIIASADVAIDCLY